jgi:hypothetical protein
MRILAFSYTSASDLPLFQPDVFGGFKFSMLILAEEYRNEIFIKHQNRRTVNTWQMCGKIGNSMCEWASSIAESDRGGGVPQMTHDLSCLIELPPHFHCEGHGWSWSK